MQYHNIITISMRIILWLPFCTGCWLVNTDYIMISLTKNILVNMIYSKLFIDLLELWNILIAFILSISWIKLIFLYNMISIMVKSIFLVVIHTLWYTYETHEIYFKFLEYLKFDIDSRSKCSAVKMLSFLS